MLSLLFRRTRRIFVITLVVPVEDLGSPQGNVKTRTLHERTFPASRTHRQPARHSRISKNRRVVIIGNLWG